VAAVAVGFPVVAAGLSWKSGAGVMSLRWTVQALCAAFGGALGLGGRLCCAVSARTRRGTGSALLEVRAVASLFFLSGQWSSLDVPLATSALLPRNALWKPFCFLFLQNSVS